MRDFTKRGRRGDVVRRFVLGLCVVAVVALLAFGAVRAAWGMYGKFAEAAAANDAAQQNLAHTKQEEASVGAQVAELSSPVGQEAQLRQSYGVALPGEGEIQIVRQATSSSAPASGGQGNLFVRLFRALFVW